VTKMCSVYYSNRANYLQCNFYNSDSVITVYAATITYNIIANISLIKLNLRTRSMKYELTLNKYRSNFH